MSPSYLWRDKWTALSGPLSHRKKAALDLVAIVTRAGVASIESMGISASLATALQEVPLLRSQVDMLSVLCISVNFGARMSLVSPIWWAQID